MKPPRYAAAERESCGTCAPPRGKRRVPEEVCEYWTSGGKKEDRA